MAASPSYGDRPPLQGTRRSFHVPNRSLSVHEKAGLDASDADEKIFFTHPNSKVIEFTPPQEAIKSDGKIGIDVDTDYPVDTIGTLPWRSRTEVPLGTGHSKIEKVRGSGIFLRCQEVVKPIMRNSQCWCVDNQSKFVFRIGKFKYYRLELPFESDEDKAKVKELKNVLPTILRYEATPCPFIRAFEVELPGDAITPRRRGTWKRESSQNGLSDAEMTPDGSFVKGRRSNRDAPPSAYPRNGPVFSSPLSAKRPGSSASFIDEVSSPFTGRQSNIGHDSDDESELGNNDTEGARSYKEEHDLERRGRPLAPRNVSTPVPVSVRIASIERAKLHVTQPHPIPRKSLTLETDLNKQQTPVHNIGKGINDDDEGSQSQGDTLLDGLLSSKQTNSQPMNLNQADTAPQLGTVKQSSDSDVQVVELTQDDVIQEPDPKYESDQVSIPEHEADQVVFPTIAIDGGDKAVTENEPAIAEVVSDETKSQATVTSIDAESGAVKDIISILDVNAEYEQSDSLEETVEPDVRTQNDHLDVVEDAESQANEPTLPPQDEPINFELVESSHIEEDVGADSLAEMIGQSDGSQDNDEGTGEGPALEQTSTEADDIDIDDAVSVVSSTDSFYTIPSQVPHADLIDAHSDYDETPVAQNSDPFLRAISSHQRSISELTVTGSPEETTGLASGTSTPTAPDLNSGLRQRLRARRSFSPMPPASTIIINPQPRHNDPNGEWAKAFLQIVFVKPVEAAIFLWHVLARIAGGATPSDLLSGELFRPPEHRRRVSGFADQLNGHDEPGIDEDNDGAQEDDFGVPIRGR